MMASTTKAEMMWTYVLPSIEKAGDILAPTRSVISSLKLIDGKGSRGFPLATYPWAIFLATIWAFRTFLYEGSGTLMAKFLIVVADRMPMPRILWKPWLDF